MQAAIYVRVSTDEQDWANQLPALERIASTRGYTLVETFRETMSGAKVRRPAFDQLLEGARVGRYQVICVWAIDRLGRNMAAIVDTVLSLDTMGVSVVSHSEPWLDTQGAVRPLMLSIMAWVAQQERERLIERTRAGVARARAAGKTLGRPKIQVDLDACVKLRKQGLSAAQVAKRLGCSRATIQRALMSDDVPASVRGRARTASVARAR